MKKSRLLGAVCACVLISIVPTTNASILDQSFIPTAPPGGAAWEVGYGGNDYIDAAQTFTVGIAGQLTSIDVYVETYVQNVDDLLVDIRPVIDGIPDSNNANVLASVLVPPANASQLSFLSVDFSAFNIQVTQGDVFAIVLSARDAEPINTDYPYIWWGNGARTGGNDPYIGGGTFGRSGSNPEWNSWGGETAPTDMGFKTYVSTVPIPPSVWLFGSGLLGLIGITRKNKKA